MDELKTVLLSTLYKTDVISRAYHKEIFSPNDVTQWIIIYSLVLGKWYIYKHKKTLTLIFKCLMCTFQVTCWGVWV